MFAKSLSDSDLARLLSNEKTRTEAFTRMVDLYKEKLYWQIRRMVINHDDADDVLQNTFLKAWQGLDSFRGDSLLSTWLYRIAANETINFLERERSNTLALDDGENSVATRLESDPYFDGDETQRLLQEAIASLPARQRQVFNLKYFDGMKYEEMSQMLDTSVGALKASYHHAVRKISDFFHSAD